MKTFLRMRQLVIVIILTSWLCSCNHECEPPVVNGDKLVEAVELGSRTAAEFKVLDILSGYGVPLSLFKYNVKVYRVKYTTKFKGDDIIASGVIAVPQTSDPVSMLSVHHGTTIEHSEAPSVQDFQSDQILLYTALASLGFITVVPDYLGFGNTSYLLHPYYVEESSASCVIDNLIAAKELAQTKGVNFNSKVFLTGYSQGGYVTMAAHKFLDQNPVPDLKLVASFPAAGGYDLKKVQELLFTQQTYSNPFYLAYVALAYKNTFDWKAPLSDLFKENYAEEIPGLFFGDLSGSAINAALSDTLSVLLNPNFIGGIDTNEQYKYFADALRSNSLVDWVPLSPMYMYHGDADTTVPYQNSVSVYQQLLANGASEDIVHFITLPGSDHSSGVVPYIKDIIPKILELNM